MKKAKLNILLIVIGAIGLWFSGRAPWLTVATTDDKSGNAANPIVGAAWAPELSALALALIAGSVAVLIMGSVGRRLVGVLSVISAVIASWAPMKILTTDESAIDISRAMDLLKYGAASQRANAPVTVSDWAVVDSVEVHALGPSGALVASALALVGGVMLIMRPGSIQRQRSSAYENPEVRRQRLEQDLAENPQSGRVLWDALDAGVDPTEDAPQAAPQDTAGDPSNTVQVDADGTIHTEKKR